MKPAIVAFTVVLLVGALPTAASAHDVDAEALATLDAYIPSELARRYVLEAYVEAERTRDAYHAAREARAKGDAAAAAQHAEAAARARARAEVAFFAVDASLPPNPAESAYYIARAAAEDAAREAELARDEAAAREAELREKFGAKHSPAGARPTAALVQDGEAEARADAIAVMQATLEALGAAIHPHVETVRAAAKCGAGDAIDALVETFRIAAEGDADDAIDALVKFIRAAEVARAFVGTDAIRTAHPHVETIRAAAKCGADDAIDALVETFQIAAEGNDDDAIDAVVEFIQGADIGYVHVIADAIRAAKDAKRRERLTQPKDLP